MGGKSGAVTLRRCDGDDFDAIYAIINDAAERYRGVIPADCFAEPYMPEEELRGELAAGVAFRGAEIGGRLAGVMGTQPRRDVVLIRHAYVRTRDQGRGIGAALLARARAETARPILIGTWAAAEWAVQFYEKRGFRRVSAAAKDRLLAEYWSVPPRQIETSVVLADAAWFARRARSI